VRLLQLLVRLTTLLLLLLMRVLVRLGYPCRLPETLNTEISKACNSIFPLQNVNIRKVKMLKAPKFDCAYTSNCIFA
jgi:ribosomal protein S3AE